MKTAKADAEIMSILKVNEISRVICDTNMGTLKLRIRKGETEYKFILDAVELPKDMNKELMEVIYPMVPAKVLTWNGEPIKSDSKEAEILKALDPHVKPKGRPKGSKNKVK